MPGAAVEELLRAERILLYGVTGSGKSTAALRRLGAVRGLPVHLVDDVWGVEGSQCSRERTSSWRSAIHVRLAWPASLGVPPTAVVTRTPVCNGNVETVRQLVFTDSKHAVALSVIRPQA